jgi:hypothetical protein
MAGGKQVAFKFRVKQEYDVIIYYEHGIVEDDYDEASRQIEEDAINIAFQHEGLVAVTDEESENANGYLALVTTHDPEVEMIYHTHSLPRELEKALKEKDLI